jgi:hypothetical protein
VSFREGTWDSRTLCIKSEAPWCSSDEDNAAIDEEIAGHDKDGRDRELDEYDEEFDVNTSMELEPSTEDADALQALLIADFDAGDVVRKLMAFVSQLRLSSDDVRDLQQEEMKLRSPAFMRDHM